MKKMPQNRRNTDKKTGKIKSSNQNQKVSKVNKSDEDPKVDLPDNKNGNVHENAALPGSKTEVENGKVPSFISDGDQEV